VVAQRRLHRGLGCRHQGLAEAIWVHPLVRRRLPGLAQRRSEPFAQRVFHDHAGLIRHQFREILDQLGRDRGGPRGSLTGYMAQVGGKTAERICQIDTR